MEPIFIQLAIILFTAFIVSFIARALKQPIIIGYIIAGVIISPFLIKFGASTEVIDVFSKFGIAFLLFIVGLHLNPKVIREIGTASLVVGLGQIILTFGLGFLVAWQALGMTLVASAYIGIALAFSSTIIITKLLSDKQNLDSLYGKISIGILIIQDLVAIGVLLFISSLSGGNAHWQGTAARTLIGGAGLIFVLFLLGYFVLPRLTKSIAKSQELLFLFSICWCFVIAALFSYFGLSIEIGALVAGVILSVTPYSTEISSKIRPLRDFFLIIFFIILGLNIKIDSLGSIVFNAIVLSALVLVFKPIILMFLLKNFKYTKRTNFLVGITLAQISEFSLIILGVGVSLGHIMPEILYTSILTMVITIVLSTYMILYSKDFYPKMTRFAGLFEKKGVREKVSRKHYDSILFGYNRIGFSILNAMKSAKRKYLVVDYNPDTITTLNKFKIPCLYGDVDDPELIKDLPLDKIKLAVSTIPDFEANFLLVENIRVVNSKAIIIVRAHTIEDALELYKKGANYVLTPHFLGGEYISKMIKEIGVKEKDYDKEKEKHIKVLEEMAGRGQDHPHVERD